MARRVAVEPQHACAAARELVERRAAHGAEPADDDIEIGHSPPSFGATVAWKDARAGPRTNAAKSPDMDRVKLVALMALLVVAIGTAAAAENVPVPPRRPAAAPAALPAAAAKIAEPAPPSACRLRLTAELAVAPSLPALSGPNECGAPDAVLLEAVVLADRTRVAVMPPATLRCEFAEAIVHWVREDIAPAARALGSALRSVDNYASYDCRGRNRVVGAKLSEHGRANALDVRLFRLADGKVLELTDPAAPRELRETLRKLTCARFNTVLGPGSDGYHENHVHVDLAPRRSGYRMCQWDVREPADPPAAAAVPLPRPRPAGGRG